jgi:hypothetical protein
VNQRAILHDDDIVVFTAATTHAVHAGMLQVYDRAKTKVAANGPDWTDGEGVVRDRQYRLTFAEVREDRSERQNKFYWGAVLKQIAAQAPGNWTPDAWHEAFKRTVLGFEVVKVRVAGRARPTVYRRLRSTTDLTVKQMSEYLEQVIATAATELGVVFDLDPVEREAVRYRKPVRKPKTESVPA